MPKPPMRQKSRPDEDEDIFGRSMIRDELSRISEGSREGASLASSAYFSVASGAASGSLDRGRILGAGGIEAARQQLQQMSVAGRSGAVPSAGSRHRGSGSDGPKADEDLKKTVRAFVETGVRGRQLEALRRDGSAQPVVFRLSRSVDAFEITAEGGRGAQRVELLEVSSIWSDTDLRQHGDLAQSLPPGLDARCTIVDLRDGRCLTLRFPGDNGEAEALVFVRCMRLFVQEVCREKGSPTADASATTAPA